ncbi:hypothetical protein F511_12316 [Dorcoceras hygrometricum]|uniref:Retrotransposon gag domain-containing protein n=1 Tax=Dorcoceras hygrometricum TaxID=472368 RepID=A0A2Z7DF96_9LAMI|nr:hypothetical protein F511_12316 [Dorcoceras hygrometricum]
MSGRGRTRRSNPLEETDSDNNANITQLLRMLVEQNNNRGNGQSSSSMGPSNDDPQEKFRRQKPKEFTGTTDPLTAESWIKSMEVIFDYLQTPDLDRPRCDDLVEGAKLSVDLLNLTWAEFKQVFFEQYFPVGKRSELKRDNTSRCIPIELIQQLHSFVRIQQLRCLPKFSRRIS